MAGEREMNILAWLVRIVSAVFSLFPRQRRVVFLSRQARRPLDFVVLEPWIKRILPEYRVVWCCVQHGGRLGPLTMLRQLWLQATSAACVVDGYVPAVCIPRDHNDGTYGNVADLRSQHDPASGSANVNYARQKQYHRDLAPVVQVWHALGAVKKFGYQALDTPDGHSLHTADALAMHRGYDIVAAGLRGATDAFAQAFDCSRSQVNVLGSPRVDYLLSDTCSQKRQNAAAEVAHRLGLEWRLEGVVTMDGHHVAGTNVASSSTASTAASAMPERGPVVLYAPTYRKHPAEPEWHVRYVDALRRALPADATLIVSGHPLDAFDDAEDSRATASLGDFSLLSGIGHIRGGHAVHSLKSCGSVVQTGEHHMKFTTSKRRTYYDNSPSDTSGASDTAGAQVRFLESAESIRALPLVDYVVSDYSAVVFEAMLASVKVLFYVPDIDTYRVSPGLNVDPERDLASLTFRDAADLGVYIAQDYCHDCYDYSALTAFEHDYGIDEARQSQGGSCRRIAAVVAMLASESSSAGDAFQSQSQSQ